MTTHLLIFSTSPMNSNNDVYAFDSREEAVAAYDELIRSTGGKLFSISVGSFEVIKQSGAPKYGSQQ